MKIIIQFARIIVGCLFIFSGFIKSNDPTGFSYKLDEYFSIFASDLMVEQDSLAICVNGKENARLAVSKVDSEIIIIIQNKDWETRIFPDCLGEPGDTCLISELLFFVGNQNVYKSLLFGNETNDFEIKSNDRVIYKKSFSTKLREVNQYEKKLNLTKYLKKESRWVGFFEWLRKYVIFLAMFISVIEILLGFALLIGRSPRLVIGILLIMILGFTFLTWYSATYDKVTDCGCFGDAIPLTPYQSFYKDLVLTILIVLLLFWNRYIKPVFSNMFSINFMLFIAILSISFTIYCEYYLPVMDFLKFKEGNNVKEMMKIPEGERAKDHIKRTYYYKTKAGKEVEVIWDSDDNSWTPVIGEGWSFVRTDKEVVLEKAYIPPIHDFKIQNADRTLNFTDSFFNQGAVKLLVVMRNLEQSNKYRLKKLSNIATEWEAMGYKLWVVTSSTPDAAEKFRHEYQLPFEFYFGDDTNLKSIIRSNPGMLLFTDSSVVKRTWPATHLPSMRKLKRLSNIKE
jgi:uncharacterized membrane protein YphA (DoxX/SURF4 family)